VQRSNLDGQAIGRKGAETLKRLMSAAAEMLDTTPLRDLRASDMARRAGISAATFYLYFENVESVVLALADSLIEPASDLIALAEKPWPIGDDAAILDFVRAYFDFWDEHRSVLRMRNLAAEEGDARFAASRLTISIPCTRRSPPGSRPHATATPHGRSRKTFMTLRSPRRYWRRWSATRPAIGCFRPGSASAASASSPRRCS
jgi:AcrR family transcriptional regulator